MTAVVVLLLAGSIDDQRQTVICLRFCQDYGLTFAAVTHDPAAVVPMIAAREVSAVVVALCPHGDPLAEVEQDVIAHGGSFLYCRRTTARVVDVEEQLIRTAIRNSKGNLALVAELLGIPLREVERMALHP